MRNTKSSVLRVAQLILIGVAIWLSLFLRVSCASNPKVTISSITDTDRVKLELLIEDINDEVQKSTEVPWKFLTKDNEFKVGDETYSIEINMTAYNKQEVNIKREIMEITLGKITNSDLSLTNRNKIYNFIANEDSTTANLVRQLSDDVSGDFGKAYFYYFKPWSGVLGTLLGCAALAIFILLGVTTVIDLAYLVLPLVQYALDTGKPELKAKFVSIEASNAVKEAESGSHGRKVDVLSCYLKSKTKQYIALAICLLYLISGNIYNLIASFIDYFAGVLG